MPATISNMNQQLSTATPTAADSVPIYDASASIPAMATVQNIRNQAIAIADAAYAFLAANSGLTHIVANVSADRTFTLPTPAAGLTYEVIADISAADGHDWIITTGSDTNYFTGGIIHLDSDAGTGADEIVPVFPDGNSNSKLQINLPEGGTWVKFISNGTTWTVTGYAVSATAPTFADQ